MEINPKPAQTCNNRAAVYYLKGEHNKAYKDAFRTQEAI